MIYEYAVKRIKLTPDGIRFSDEVQNEHMMLNEMGRKGFRYIGYHPADVIGIGRNNSIALIFERIREEV